jgi:hypothetical protein
VLSLFRYEKLPCISALPPMKVICDGTVVVSTGAENENFITGVVGTALNVRLLLVLSFTVAFVNVKEESEGGGVAFSRLQPKKINPANATFKICFTDV